MPTPGVRLRFLPNHNEPDMPQMGHCVCDLYRKLVPLPTPNAELVNCVKFSFLESTSVRLGVQNPM